MTTDGLLRQQQDREQKRRTLLQAALEQATIRTLTLTPPWSRSARKGNIPLRAILIDVV